jgi:hypothetical protein
MALPSNTFATYEAIGNREDLSDMIYRIDPTDTPFVSMAEREKATAVNHEWQTQDLAAVDTANAVLEGDDATTDAVTPTVRLGNICQISDKVARVTGTQQAVEHAGRDDEMAYQEMLKGLELKRDMETILSAQPGQGDGADATAAQDGLGPVVDQDQHRQGTAGGAADPTAADGTAPARTARSARSPSASEDVSPVHLDERRQARHDHDRRLQQAGVLDLHGPGHSDGRHQGQEDHRIGRCV